MDRNPYASPTTATASGGLRRVPVSSLPSEPELGIANVVEPAAKPPRAWRLAFGADEAWLFAEGESTAFVLSHAELAEHGNITRWGNMILLGVRGLLPDGRAIAFKVEGDAIPLLRRWVVQRRDIHVATALKKRLRFSLPIGVFVAATALPIIGSRLDPFALAFGVGVATLAVVGPRYPRAGLFAVDGLLWLSLAASHGFYAAAGSTFSLVFAVFCLLIAWQSYRTFAFYR